MYRNIRVVARNGREYEVPVTARQAAFYLKLAEFKARTDPAITFGDLLVEKREKELQRRPEQRY
jgi:hypothetical protein